MKKGFTIIELLAVIVIVALLAVITFPIITGIINKSKLNALKSSAYGLVDASNYYYAQYQNTSNIRFDIDGKNAVSTDTTNPLKFKGNIKEGVVIVRANGQSVVCVTDGKNSAYKNFNESQVNLISGKKCTIPSNSSIVYLNGEASIDIVEAQQILDEIAALKTQISSLNEQISNQSSGVPALDYGNPLYTIDSSHLTYTATKESYLVGTYVPNGNNIEGYITINGKVVAWAWNSSAVTTSNVMFKLSAGDVVAVSNIRPSANNPLQILVER